MFWLFELHKGLQCLSVSPIKRILIAALMLLRCSSELVQELTAEMNRCFSFIPTHLLNESDFWVCWNFSPFLCHENVRVSAFEQCRDAEECGTALHAGSELRLERSSPSPVPESSRRCSAETVGHFHGQHQINEVTEPSSGWRDVV